MKSLPEIMVLVQRVQPADVAAGAGAVARFCTTLHQAVNVMPNNHPFQKLLVMDVLKAVAGAAAAVCQYARNGNGNMELLEFLGDVGDLGRDIAAQEKTGQELECLRMKYN